MEGILKVSDPPIGALRACIKLCGVLHADRGYRKSVAQIGPPPSVAALRQRLGRSGRRPGEAAILRAYVMEHEVTTQSPLSDRLREGLLQSAVFDSGRPMVHEQIRAEMRRILEEDTEMEFLDSGARDLLLEARKLYRDAHLSERMVVMDGKAVLLLPWSGDLANNALVLLLRSLGLMSGSNEGLVVRCEGWDLNRLSDACSDIVALDHVDLLAMLEDVENLGQGKWDWALPRELLVQSYASLHLDIAGAKRIAANVVEAIRNGT